MHEQAEALYAVIRDVYKRYPEGHELRIKAVLSLRHYLPTLMPFDDREEMEYVNNAKE